MSFTTKHVMVCCPRTSKAPSPTSQNVFVKKIMICDYHLVTIKKVNPTFSDLQIVPAQDEFGSRAAGDAFKGGIRLLS
jgi:hypothetical protein